MWWFVFVLCLTTSNFAFASPASPTSQQITAPSLWRFDGPLSIEFQRHLIRNYKKYLPTHLLTEESMIEYIDHRSSPSNLPLSCLSDKKKCNLIKVLMQNLSLKEFIISHSEWHKNQFKISLTITRISSTNNLFTQTYTESGKTLDKAAETILNKVLGIGKLSFSSLPPNAKVLIDGQDILVQNLQTTSPIGQHKLLIIAPGYVNFEYLEVKN